MLGLKEVPTEPMLAAVMPCGPGMRTEKPGEVALRESSLERVTRIPTKLWKRPLISLSNVQRGKLLHPP